MRRVEKLTAAGVMLAGLGALAGFAIGSGEAPQKLVARRMPPVEVRTEVIRRTVNVYRREHPHHVAGSGPGGRATPPARAGSTAVRGIPARTRTSGRGSAVPAASPAPTVITRSSGRSTARAPASSGSETVRTRTSGGSSSGGGSGSTRRVSTRASGHGDGESSGGHDD